MNNSIAKKTTRSAVKTLSTKAPATTQQKGKRTISKIIHTGHVSYHDQKVFTKKLHEEIETLQNGGMQVEVQYSCTNSCFTALLIGRKEIEVK